MENNPMDNLVNFATTALTNPDATEEDRMRIFDDVVKEAREAAIPTLRRVVVDLCRQWN